MVIKGILDPEDARDAVRFGADGIVVSNHGGRQLDGVLSSARALPAIADAVKGDITILADSGIRNGLDVVRMIALGADSVLLGRAYLYALATHGKQGVANLLNLIEKEMKVAMTLTGAKTIGEISRESLVQNADALRTFDAIKAGNAAVILTLSHREREPSGRRVNVLIRPSGSQAGAGFLPLSFRERSRVRVSRISAILPPQLRGQHA